MESQGQIAVSNVCRAVVRAVEKLDEEWSPATLDVMIFHSNQLYRLLLAYCGDTHVLEEVGRSLTLLSEIEGRNGCRDRLPNGTDRLRNRGERACCKLVLVWIKFGTVNAP